MSEQAKPVCKKCGQPVSDVDVFIAPDGSVIYSGVHLHPRRCISALRAALDQERAKVERLRAAAHSAADCIVHALYNEDGLCASIGEPALDELEAIGVVSALLSGRGETTDE